MAEKKNTAAEEAAKKALEAAQAKKAAGKVQHTYTQVGQQSASKEELLAVTRKNALPYRIAAIILWVLAICFEIFAILLFVHKIEFGFTVENPGWTISWIVCIVLDLVCEPHQVARAVAQQASRVGEFDAEAVADEKTRIQLGFKRLERLGERRLSQVQPRRGTGHVLLLRYS